MRLKSQRSIISVKAIILIAVTLLQAACSSADPRVEEGRVLYQQYCASCHGVDGEGQANWQRPDESGNLPAPPHDNTGHTWHHSDAQLLATISEGRNNMPGYAGLLTPAQQEAILAYIKTFWSPEIRAAQEGVNR